MHQERSVPRKKVGNMKADATFAKVGRVLWIVVKKRGLYVVCQLGGVKNVVEG